MNVTWGQFITLALTTGLVTAIVNQLLTWGKEHYVLRRQQSVDSAYLAMRVAVALEAFALACVIRHWNDQADIDEGRGETTVPLPELKPFPDGPEWKWLDRRIADEMLTIRNSIDYAKDAAEFSAIRESNPVADIDEPTILGASALQLARRIRSKYDLGEAAFDRRAKDALHRLERQYQAIERRSA